MKKIILILLTFFVITSNSYASNKKIEFSIFTRENCFHCIELKNFLNNNLDKNNLIVPKYYNIDLIKNKTIFDKFTSDNQISKITPIILIGDKIIEGFESEKTTGKRILENLKNLKSSSYFENYNFKINIIDKSIGCGKEDFCNIQKKEFLVKLPLIGIIDLKKYSILFLSIILGFVDGFNPCAMWVLVMFISILSQTGSKKKMIQVASIFMLAEAIMYYLILNLWYKTWDFVKLDNIITPIIGIISIGAGIFFIYEFFTNKNGECKVVSSNQKKKTIERIKMIASKQMSIGIFFLTIGIAFGVNIIEFACSVGIPQAYTKLLDLSNFNFLLKQFYIGIYTLFYMADDFIVFIVAIYAFSHIHLTTKYSKYCLILGGIIMILLGYFFIFNPNLLKLVI